MWILVMSTWNYEQPENTDVKAGKPKLVWQSCNFLPQLVFGTIWIACKAQERLCVRRKLLKTGQK